jgi:hypothetical protein
MTCGGQRLYPLRKSQHGRGRSVCAHVPLRRAPSRGPSSPSGSRRLEGNKRAGGSALGAEPQGRSSHAPRARARRHRGGLRQAEARRRRGAGRRGEPGRQPPGLASGAPADILSAGSAGGFRLPMMSSAACAKLYRRASELTCVRLRAGTLRARAPAGREMRASIMVFRSGKAGRSCRPSRSPCAHSLRKIIFWPDLGHDLETTCAQKSRWRLS